MIHKADQSRKGDEARIGELPVLATWNEDPGAVRTRYDEV